VPIIEPIHPRPPQHAMPFVPGIRVRNAGSLLFVSGAMANPLYHKHPHDPAELTPPDDIREQTRRVMENLKGCSTPPAQASREVVKLTKFLTRTNEQDVVWSVMQPYFGEHLPTSTTVEVSALVVPGLRVEVELIARSSAERFGRASCPLPARTDRKQRFTVAVIKVRWSQHDCPVISRR
jgi:2-iminobutanoate/2-iminopropanoate deaminase